MVDNVVSTGTDTTGISYIWIEDFMYSSYMYIK